MVKLPDCKNCIKNDVCEHMIDDVALIQSSVESAVNYIKNKTPFKAEIELKIICKSFAESVGAVKKEPKFTRQEVIDKLKGLADLYNLTLFVASNGRGATDEQLRVIFHEWEFDENVVVAAFDLKEMGDEWYPTFREALKDKLLNKFVSR